MNKETKHKNENSKKEENSIIKKIDNEFDSKKKFPYEEELKINSKVMKNILIAITILTYFLLINLASINIQESNFLVILKIASMLMLFVAIGLFEISYKKDNGQLCIYGIETLIVSIISLLSIYIFTIFPNYFQFLMAYISLLIAIYYIAKSIITYQKMKNAYYKSLNDIKQIVKKDRKKDSE